MDKFFFILLASPSLLLGSSGPSPSSEPKTFFLAKSDDRNAGSRSGRSESRGPRGDQNRGRDRNQRQEVRERRDFNPQTQEIDRDVHQKQNIEINTPVRSKESQISKEQIRDKENQWQSQGREWRRTFTDNRTRDHVFDDHYWDNFRRNNNNWYFDNNFRWDSRPNWSNIALWLPWQWKEPLYYYYENDNIYYTSTQDYTDLTPIDSKEQFIAQAVKIANSKYPISSQQADWMPLGMFTIASDSDDTPKRYLTLAISKQGALTGAYFNALSNTTLEIQGGIDPESQRIAWKFAGKDWPIMESSLYNLTKSESTLLIHTSYTSTKTQLLINLKQ